MKLHNIFQMNAKYLDLITNYEALFHAKIYFRYKCNLLSLVLQHSMKSSATTFSNGHDMYSDER